MAHQSAETMIGSRGLLKHRFGSADSTYEPAAESTAPRGLYGASTLNYPLSVAEIIGWSAHG